MLSQNIKILRMQKGLTQKELADLLHVTSQAVSRWEKGDVEPSIDTINNMAKIFEVSTDEIINGIKEHKIKNKEEDEENEEVKERVTYQTPKMALGLCEICNEPIYNKEDIVRARKGFNEEKMLICKNCFEQKEQEIVDMRVSNARTQRIKSFIFSGIIAAVLLAILIFGGGSEPVDIASTIIVPVLSFTFASCLFLKNNFVQDLFFDIVEWGFVRFPGIIFSFDLDGFIFLIAMKVLFWIIGVVIGAAASFLALIVGMIVSVFVYPFALIKSYTFPEETEAEDIDRLVLKKID